jgi:uncharacterized protein YbdZ (MbtH family)
MAGGFDDENGKFRVLVNEEEQYSLWLDGMEIPRGWTDTGVAGDKKTCLDYGRTCARSRCVFGWKSTRKKPRPPRRLARRRSQRLP